MPHRLREAAWPGKDGARHGLLRAWAGLPSSQLCLGLPLAGHLRHTQNAECVSRGQGSVWKGFDPAGAGSRNFFMLDHLTLMLTDIGARESCSNSLTFPVLPNGGKWRVADTRSPERCIPLCSGPSTHAGTTVSVSVSLSV